MGLTLFQKTSKSFSVTDLSNSIQNRLWRPSKWKCPEQDIWVFRPIELKNSTIGLTLLSISEFIGATAQSVDAIFKGKNCRFHRYFLFSLNLYCANGKIWKSRSVHKMVPKVGLEPTRFRNCFWDSRVYHSTTRASEAKQVQSLRRCFARAACVGLPRRAC